MIRITTIVAVLFSVLFLPVKLNPQTSEPKSLRYGNRTIAAITMGVGKFKTDVYNGAQLHAKNDEITLSLQTMNGFWYMERLFIGVGVGVERWQNGLFWPIYGNLTYRILNRENTFFGTLSLGSSIGNRYGTTFYNAGKGGFMATVGLGYMVKVTKKLKFTYDVFYHY
jgi:hypothetical protein